MFYEVCLYEAKPEKADEIETLMREVAEFYRAQDGVITVRYIKRTHRHKDFNAVKAGGTKTTVNRWENGKKPPSFILEQKFKKFCKDNGINPDELQRV